MQTSVLRFDQFELDLNSYELRKSGRLIKLEKLPMELLILLAEGQGQLVSREQIIRRLWGDNIFVDTRQGINTAVRKLRIALQDDSEHPRLIQTLPGRGYRLLAPVSGAEAYGSTKAVEPSELHPAASPIEIALPNPISPTKGWRPGIAVAGAAVILLAIASLAALLFVGRSKPHPPFREWVQVTNFPDSATQPVLSPDGHMVAFIRGPETFVTPGEIYVKILPDGEAIRLTHDGLPKMAPAFSPDGSRVAFTATDRSFGWNTWVVPVLGGESKELLPNAAALTWNGRQHVIFSEIKTGVRMGIVTSAESRAEERDIYLPSSATGMAHRSWISPDGKWILVSEMGISGWMCRVLPFDGSASGELVGPKPAQCTYAGWSPNGRTMYFSADAGDGYHIWRQHFPSGVPEQLTFGPTEEEGIAVSNDGRTLMTSAGIRESTVWVHDSHGDRQVSGEGYARLPGIGYSGGGSAIISLFSPDGKRLFYLVSQQGSREVTSGELWMTDLDTGLNQLVLPGILMSEFRISPDGERVVFTAQDAHGSPHVWVALLNRGTPPRELSSSVSMRPNFGPGGDIYFMVREGTLEFLYRVGTNETVPRKVEPEPVSDYQGISPRAEFWITALGTVSKIVAHSTQGGPAIQICTFCGIGWGPNGKFFYLRFRDIGAMGGGKTLAFELRPGKELPVLPPSGLKSAEDMKGLKAAAEFDMTGKGVFAPGPNPSIYAYTRVIVQRNLYRIPLE
jgi:DNA-binding winged helix-turn-helix (wHTH) protein/Tol biopolymer transport system component